MLRLSRRLITTAVLLGLLVLPVALLPLAQARADGRALTADLNIVTAIDASDSIGRHEEWLQYAGLAEALEHPDFLRLAFAGPRGRVGFTVIAWASDGEVRSVLPWSVIETPADARRLATALRKAPRRSRTAWETVGDAEEAAASDEGPGRTDLALAIGAANAWLQRAPLTAPRSALNLLSNGVDNAGAPPEAARDAALRPGVAINAVVFGAAARAAPYFERRVIGGSGAFLLQIEEPGDMIDTLSLKFWLDIASGTEPDTGSFDAASRPKACG